MESAENRETLKMTEPRIDSHQFEELITYDHKCSLKDEPHYLLNRLRSRQSCAFRVRQWFLIDSEHPQTKRFYRSTYLFRTELIRHVKSDYWFIIHPFSQFRFYWDVWLLCYIYGIMLLTPFTIAFAGSLRNGNYIYYISSVINVLATMEVVINCLTGYSTDKYKRDIQLSPWKIFKHYLSGTFLVDFMFAFPASLLVMIFSDHVHWLDVSLNAVNGILIFKLVSVRLIWNYLTNFFERFGIDMIKYYVLRLFLVSGLFIHWCICFYKLAVTVIAHSQQGVDPPWDEHVKYLLNSDNGMAKRYGYCFSTVLYYLFVLSFGELGIPKTVHGKVIGAVCIIIGICFQFYLFQPLRKQIADSSATRFYKKVTVFQGIPGHFLLPLVRTMEKEIYLPNDMIMKAGTVGSSMGFIYTGSVAVYTQSGKEIVHLHDGDNFGEISLFLKSKRLVNVIAIEFTQIFVLRRKVFLELISPENVLYQRLEEMAKERMQQTLLEEEQYKSHLLMVDGGANE